jgi:hypothetical protein
MGSLGTGTIRIASDDKRWHQIVNVVRILKSNLTNEEKTTEIYRRLGAEARTIDPKFIKLDSEYLAIAELVKNFQPHPQLDQRIAELEKTMPIPLWSPPAVPK